MPKYAKIHDVITWIPISFAMCELCDAVYVEEITPGDPNSDIRLFTAPVSAWVLCVEEVKRYGKTEYDLDHYEKGTLLDTSRSRVIKPFSFGTDDMDCCCSSANFRGVIPRGTSPYECLDLLGSKERERLIPEEQRS